MSSSEVLLNTGAIAQGIVVLTDYGLNAFPSGGNPYISIKRTPSLQTVTSAGTVAANKKSITFANVGNGNGTVLGSTITPGISITFEAPNGDTIDEISYDATGTTLLIATLT